MALLTHLSLQLENGPREMPETCTWEGVAAALATLLPQPPEPQPGPWPLWPRDPEGEDSGPLPQPEEGRRRANPLRAQRSICGTLSQDPNERL